MECVDPRFCDQEDEQPIVITEVRIEDQFVSKLNCEGKLVTN